MLCADLEADLRRQLEAKPEEGLGHLLQRHAPRAAKTGRALLWLDWGTCGHLPAQPRLLPRHLDAWMHFAAETLAPRCPDNLRLISYLALETPDPTQEKGRLAKLRRELIGHSRFDLDEIALGTVDEKHLLNYLRDHTDCPEALHVEIAERIHQDTDGAFDRTVSWLDRGVETGAWNDLRDELRRLQSAPPGDPDDEWEQ